MEFILILVGATIAWFATRYYYRGELADAEAGKKGEAGARWFALLAIKAAYFLINEGEQERANRVIKFFALRYFPPTHLTPGKQISGGGWWDWQRDNNKLPKDLDLLLSGYIDKHIEETFQD